MKFRKIILVITAMLMANVPFSVSAAESGIVRVELPKELSGATVCLFSEDEEEQTIRADEQGVATVSNLEEGTYVIRIPETQGYTFTEAEVKVPMWNETATRMSYEVSVIPKYSRNVETPKTGDENRMGLYAALGSGALALVGVLVFRKKQ